MQALMQKREKAEAVSQASKAKYLETRGNLSFSNWFNAKDEKTGEALMVPGRIQYVLDSLDRKHKGWVSPSEQYWFVIETPVSPDRVIVNARKGRDNKGLPITVVKGDAVPNPEAPEWMAKAVKDEILPWLLPLAASGYRKPIITRDDDKKLVFVDRAGFHAYWSRSPTGRKLSFINVEKGDRDSAGGASLQIQFDLPVYEKIQIHSRTVTCERKSDFKVLYFSHGGRRVGMRFDYRTNELESAWEKPALPFDPQNTHYDPIAVTPGLEQAARKTLAELEDALKQAEKTRSSVSMRDFGQKIADATTGKG